MIDGKQYYFNKDHSQLKGGWAEGRYYDAVTGEAAINQFIQMAANQWAYLNQQGYKVTGLQTINDKVYYFGNNGAVKKVKCLHINGKKCYFDAHTGKQVAKPSCRSDTGCWLFQRSWSSSDRTTGCQWETFILTLQVVSERSPCLCWW